MEDYHWMNKGGSNPPTQKAVTRAGRTRKLLPVSNLSFISKILEKVVAKRLSSHKTSESLYEPFQSV